MGRDMKRVMNSSAKGGLVLYVEDHDDTRILITKMLEGAGFRVTPADCGEECLRAAGGGRRFDLYLLDYTFPDASGVMICKALRKLDPDTPILFYSGRAMPEEREAALGAGAQDYLIKPDDLFDVAPRVGEWIEASRRRRKG